MARATTGPEDRPAASCAARACVAWALLLLCCGPRLSDVPALVSAGRLHEATCAVERDRTQGRDAYQARQRLGAQVMLALLRQGGDAVRVTTPTLAELTEGRIATADVDRRAVLLLVSYRRGERGPGMGAPTVYANSGDLRFYSLDTASLAALTGERTPTATTTVVTRGTTALDYAGQVIRDPLGWALAGAAWAAEKSTLGILPATKLLHRELETRAEVRQLREPTESELDRAAPRAAALRTALLAGLSAGQHPASWLFILDRAAVARSGTIDITLSPFYRDDRRGGACGLAGRAWIHILPGSTVEERVAALFHGDFLPLADIAEVRAPSWH